MSSTMTYSGTVRLITINDIYQNLPDTHGLGGWATVSTLIQQYRTNTTHQCIVIVNGDFLGGSQLAEHSSGMYAVDILDVIGVDYVVIGNHELDFGSDGLIKCMEHSPRIKWLGSNVRHNDTNKTLFQNVTDYNTERVTLKRKRTSKLPETTANGHSDDTVEATIGLFGLTTPATPVLSFPGDAVVFDDLKQHTTRVIQQLKQTNAIVAVTHLHMAEDRVIATHSSTCAKPITLSLAGHDHDLSIATVDDTVIVKTGQNANHLGVIDLTIELDIDTVTQQRICRTYPSYHFIVNKDVPADDNILRVVDRYQKLMDSDTDYPDLDQVVATVQCDVNMPDSYFDVCETYLCTHSSIVRTQETVFAQLIADSMQHHYLDEHCDCAIINGGFIRNNTIYPLNTQLTIRALLLEVPFPKYAVLVRISGQHLRQALEFMLSHFPTAVGVFLSGLSSSLRVHVDMSAPPMERITGVTINDKRLVDSKQYRVSITTFMLLGGDNNDAWTNGVKINTDEYKVADIFVKYISQHRQTIEPRMKRRLVLQT